MTQINDEAFMKFKYQSPNKPFIVTDVDTKDPIVVEFNEKYNNITARHWYLDKNGDDHRRTKKGVTLPVGDILPLVHALLHVYNQLADVDEMLVMMETATAQKYSDAYPHEDEAERINWYNW